MDETSVRSRLEEIGLDDGQIADVLPLLADIAQPADDGGLRAAQLAIFEQISNEQDWRKRAALAAKLISMSTDY